MKRFAFALLALAGSASAARADVITQSFDYDWDSSQIQHAFSFDPFDDLGGARQLTGVRLGFDGTISMEITAQTYDPTPIPEGDWTMEVSHTVVAYFNDEGVDLLQGIGGQWAADVSGDLGGGSDGNPGTPYIFTQSIDFANTVDIESMYWAHFTAGQPLGGFMDGFFDGFVIPPESGQWIEIFPSLLTQAGTVTLSYEYVAVPEPGSLAVLGVIGGLMLVRRRR
jgi:hypothetical protein